MKRDLNMINMKTQLELLTRHVMGSCLELVNFISSKDTRGYKDVEKEELDKETRYLSNHLGGSVFSYQRQGRNQSRANNARYINEDVLDRIVMGVEGTDKILREIRFDFYRFHRRVVSQSIFINKLEAQVNQITSQLNTRQKEGQLSGVVVNPNINDHIEAIVTRSG